MKRLMLLCLLLVVSAVHAAVQPALPTTFYGTVQYDDGTPAAGIEITATWIDNDGVSQSRTITTRDAASSSGEPGQFYFTSGYVLAAPGTQITLTSDKSPSTLQVGAQPGSRAFSLDEPFVITRVSTIAAVAPDEPVISITSFDTVALISSKLNVPAQTQLLYGEGTLDGLSASTVVSTDHTAILYPLKPNTEYAYSLRVQSASNTQETPVALFKTRDASTIAFSELDVSIEGTVATLSWSTEKPCRGTVFYGIGQLTTAITESDINTQHTLALAQLQPATRYVYGVVCAGEGAFGSSLGDELDSFYSQGSNAQPQLPTLLSGEIDNDDGPIVGVPVEAHFVDARGEERVVTTKTISMQEAAKLGDLSLEGSFFFRDEQINAQANTPITVHVAGRKDSSVQVVAKPGEHVTLEDPLHVPGKLPVVAAPKVRKANLPPAPGEEKWYDFVHKRNFRYSLILIISVGVFIFLFSVLVKYLRVSYIRNMVLASANAMVEREFKVFSVEEEANANTAYKLFKTRLGVFLIESLLWPERKQQVQVTDDEIRKLAVVVPGQMRSIELSAEGQVRKFFLTIYSIIEDQVEVGINQRPEHLYLKKGISQTLRFDMGEMGLLTINVISIKKEKNGPEAYILFKLGE